MEHRIDVGGVELFVEEQGVGPVVLFGHSLLCDGAIFSAQVQDLARDHRVLNVDFRGHGRSGSPSGHYTMEDQAEDYRRVLDALQVDRAVVVGLSMGGMAGMRFALRHPERVRGLVLMNTSADKETVISRLKYGVLGEIFRRFGPLGFIVRQVDGKMFSRTFLSEHADRVQSWNEQFERLDRQGGSLAVHMVRRRTDITARLAEITAPTLIVVGEEDVATPLPFAHQMADRIPRARLEILPSTGHLSTVEQPEKTTKLIREFLESLPRES